MIRFRTLLAGLLAAGVAAGAVTGAVAAPSGRLMVYTSQPSDQMAKVVEAFRKAHPDIRVELFRSGTTEVMNKLQAELAAGRPQADIVLIADAVAMTQLKNDNRLLSYPDAPASKVPAALIDPDRTYFGTKLITTGIVINTNLVKSAPKSWRIRSIPAPPSFISARWCSKASSAGAISRRWPGAARSRRGATAR
jgi:iron(III) transport system substrate-binding protein